MKTVPLMMPRLGETMEEGRIVGWMIKIGEHFKRGQSIIEIETDKTIVEFPALCAGVLEEILAEEGDMIAVGDEIGSVGLKDEDNWNTQSTPTEIKQTSSVSEKTENCSQKTNVPIAENLSQKLGEKIRATPVARKIARQEKIELHNVSGTGRRGRIEAVDVQAFISGEKPSGKTPFQILGDLAFVETGPQNAPTVLLFHGFGGDHSTFVGLTNRLSRLGIRSLNVDLPGHGETTLEANSVEDLSEGLGQFVAQKSRVGKLHVVAHSLGAIPAVALALDVDLASLTLIAPAGIGDAIDAEFIKNMSAPSSMKQVSDMLARLTTKPVSISQSAIEALYTQLAKGRLQNLKNSIIENGIQAHSIKATLRKIAGKIPVHIAVGHQDRITSWKDSLAISPLISVHHFDQSGHMPHWDQQSEFVDLLAGIILE